MSTESAKGEKSRWHHKLPPSIEARSHRNPLSSTVLHPTHAVLSKGEEEFYWQSRNHRKNRHVQTRKGKSRSGDTVLKRIALMRHLEYWNISWWVAMMFTLGSVVWVVNGFYAFLPFVSDIIPDSEDSVGVGWTAWLGATIFEFGAVLGVLEAWNRDDVVDFGWAVTETLPQWRSRDESNGNSTSEKVPRKRKWMWFSTDGKYWHELGFLAAFVQFWAATIFWISGFTAIPMIQESIMSSTGLWDGVFWTPQVVGGTGFIISSTLLMLETQSKWYIPAPLSLGWHIGLWNLIGAVGFTLCGAFGYASKESSGIAYQSSLSTFWGGWAFLIGSVIQWYESVNSGPS